MRFQSTIFRLSNKAVLLFGFIVLVAYLVYAIIMKQAYLAFSLLAVFFFLILFTKTTSTVYRYANKLFLLSLYILISIYTYIIFLGADAFKALMLFIILMIPLLFTRLKITTYIYLALILLFEQVGTDYTGKAFNLYDKGRGMLPFELSLVNVLLLFIAVSIIIHKIILYPRKGFNHESFSCNLYKYFWIFNLLFGCYVIWGIVAGIPPSQIFHRRGVINIVNLGVFVFVMLNIFRADKDYERVKNMFMGFVAIKAFWGLVRYIFLKGDPVNMYAYATYDGKAIGLKKITFFDVTDNLMLGIGAFYALWMLVNSKSRLSRSSTLFYSSVAIICIFDIVFSYRRAAWGGLVMSLAWFFLNMPMRKRIAIGIPAGILCIVLLSNAASQRFGEGEGLGAIAPDIVSKKSGGVTADEGRFLEIKTAWQTIKKNPIFGMGPWGKYKAIRLSKRVDLGLPTNLVHSSVFHLWLKMGLIGVLVFIAFFYKYVQFWLTRRREMPLEIRGFEEAAFAGFLFLIPEIFFATIIIEYRTMALLGLCFAIPYIGYYLYKKKSQVMSHEVFLQNKHVTI
ncbi:MAG: O-antigen ligase family protein [Candidatus Omnitrophica bacterium]|nr:O-antigen ligase family protein [Candidatus Omnitrophota bacterium]